MPASSNGTYFDIVDRLTTTIRGYAHRVFYDNLYTSVPLARHLLQNKIYSCGTLRVNRKMICEDVKKSAKNLPRGYSITKQDADNRNLTCSLWKDTKDVRFLSTLSDPSEIVQASRRISAEIVDINQPLCAKQYNSGFQGVDRHDQLRSSYEYGRFSKKVWKYMFQFAVNCAIVNAYILYCKTSTKPKPKKFAQLHYRIELGHQLIAGYSCRSKVVCKPAYLGANAPENVLSHLSVHMKAKRARHCFVHKQYHGKVRETVYGCKLCGVHLCRACHFRFHSN